jgi:simple sugar transport system substrate-binding protein
MVAAQAQGKMAVAYHSDMRRVAPDAQLLAVTHEWGAYYTTRVRAMLDGNWKSGNVWGGLKEGMIRVGDFGPRLPKAVQDEVAARQSDMAQGRLQAFAATSADVRDNQGLVRIRKGAALTDAQILAMDWAVEGVQSKAP